MRILLKAKLSKKALYTHKNQNLVRLMRNHTEPHARGFTCKVLETASYEMVCLRLKSRMLRGNTAASHKLLLHVST